MGQDADNEISVEEFSEVACPDCGWDEGYSIAEGGGYYVVRNGEVFDVTGYNEETNKTFPQVQDGEKAYPIYKDEQYDAWASMEFGGNQRTWTEVYMCPNCNKEFELDNGSC